MLPRLLHVAFVRSPHAHAVVRRLDPKAAQAVDGVVAVVGPADLRAQPLAPQLAGDGFRPTAWPALASEPRFCGEAVAVRPDGRANPNQLMLLESTKGDIARLREKRAI